MRSVALLLAQGFGVGRLRPAPGTWGSVLGLLWVTVLLLPGSLWFYWAGMAAGFAVCVWLCDLAEKLIGKKDPSSVVLDEVAAMPLCFLAPVLSARLTTGAMESLTLLFSGQNCLRTLALFVAFRVFDVWKPWPIRQSQRLPGGWGITVDDFIAAFYVNLAWLATSTLIRVWG